MKYYTHREFGRITGISYYSAFSYIKKGLVEHVTIQKNGRPVYKIPETEVYKYVTIPSYRGVRDCPSRTYMLLTRAPIIISDVTEWKPLIVEINQNNYICVDDMLSPVLTPGKMSYPAALSRLSLTLQYVLTAIRNEGVDPPYVERRKASDQIMDYAFHIISELFQLDPGKEYINTLRNIIYTDIK
ncbi:MAG: hypothetical protein QXO22_04220 [Thermosphaera sp.]